MSVGTYNPIIRNYQLKLNDECVYWFTNAIDALQFLHIHYPDIAKNAINPEWYISEYKNYLFDWNKLIIS